MGCRGIRRHYLNPEERLPLRIWHHQGAKRDVGNSNVPTGGNADGRIGIIQVEHARGQFIQSECEKILTSLGLRVPHRCQTTCCIAATLEQWLCQNTMCLIKPQLPRQDRLIDTGWCTKSSDVNTSCWSTEWCDKHVDVHVSPVSSEVHRGERASSKRLTLKVGFGNTAGLLMSHVLVPCTKTRSSVSTAKTLRKSM